MDTLPPYKINVYNRATEISIGHYRSNQVPREGDTITFPGHHIEGDPFEHWSVWKIDRVIWTVAALGSSHAAQIARSHRGHGEAVCTDVDLHVWPTNCPCYVNPPKWAKALAPPGYHDDEEASEANPEATTEAEIEAQFAATVEHCNEQVNYATIAARTNPGPSDV